MFSRIFIVAILLTANLLGAAQITTEPQLPVVTKAVTITFNSAEEGRLGYYTGDLYAHTGVLIEGKNDWQHVIGDWGQNEKQPKLTHKGDGIYELVISPDIHQFYSVENGERVTHMMFVFRSSDSEKQTNDLSVNVYEDGLVVEISEPSGSSILEKNKTITISARSSLSAALKLSVNESLLTESSGFEISTTHTFSKGGNYWLIAEATAEGETVIDSLNIFVRDDVVLEPKPEEFRTGINYPSDNSAALVLYAPLKDFVFVIGDFNKWEVTAEFQMKKDGDYFWIEIPDLEKGKEYIFQYFIDGELKIADPYTEKIVDPWNDKYISEEVYPDLITYPEDKTEGIAAILQPGQEDYLWEVQDFKVPEKNKLVIYELLVRDFTEDQSFQSVIDNLDYLEDLRINVLELMPVNEFEGNNSWGYNPSFYFAPDKFYGPKNKLKELIDECHKRGIAVVIDMVLNHSYGQSPFALMYMDNWKILPENPWYNVESPNPVYQWGYDFNHEREVVKELIDSVNSFWINEYKVDGFRFDFTKGFTQTPGDGWNYDASRIAILKRMADNIWQQDPDNLVILEHLAENSEERELADHGLFLWGNMHGSYNQAARGNVNESDLSWSIFEERGWSEANLIAYPESHDEERILYDIKRTGLSNGDYNVKNQRTALERIELNSLFHIPLPGPKMIWQFGERGYDLSINRCEDGTINNDCRLSPKPPYWHYLNNSYRTDLFQVVAKLNELKQTYKEFSPDNFDYDLINAIKWYRLSKDNHHALAIGNFDIIESDKNITFPTTGKWYEFFSRDSIEITANEQNIKLTPGEYRLYSNRMFDDPRISTETDYVSVVKENVSIYPNPAFDVLNISSATPISLVEFYSISGKLMVQNHSIHSDFEQISLEGFSRGVYVVRIVHTNGITTKKVLLK